MVEIHQLIAGVGVAWWVAVLGLTWAYKGIRMLVP